MSFVLGLLIGVIICVCVLQHTVRLVQGAWIVREDQTSITIRFNHDATDQVMSAKIPVPDFPSSKGHQSASRTTIDIWHESDSVTEELMQTNAYAVERRAMLDSVGWRVDLGKP